MEVIWTTWGGLPCYNFLALVTQQSWIWLALALIGLFIDFCIDFCAAYRQGFYTDLGSLIVEGGNNTVGWLPSYTDWPVSTSSTSLWEIIYNIGQTASLFP